MTIQSKATALASAAAVFICIYQPLAKAEQQPSPKELQNIAMNERRHFGDAPDNPGPLASDLSYSTKPKAVAKAMRKVADWQLERSQPFFDNIWTWSVLYSGFMATSDSLGDAKYRDAMMAMGQKFDWKERSHLPNADDESIAQTYLEFYLLKKDPAMLAPTQSELDAILAAPRGSAIPGKEIAWWWCDALFMAPPVWARMYAATGDKKYIDYLDEEWAKTSGRLYDTQEHLFARDSTYLTKTEANGKKMFWSRGNGWVMGGIIRTLQYLSKDDPALPKYIAQLQEMAARVAALQGSDGLWKAGLLDPDSYNLPEMSGSAFFTYALAAGVNQGWLDKKVYRPVIETAWAGMLHHVYADGRLGCIQQTGADPQHFKASASYTYGVGAFLLAGSEIRKMN
ncbi:MAG TPA: glycoside hydrolase family 88 protein [Terracidiphilus sp.]|nr:glycoside hydrolase family 88 protein [Terracidiphilus sp.]